MSLFSMKFLKGFSIQILVGLNVFILFLLFFEDKIVVPGGLGVVGRMHPLVLHFPIVLLFFTVLLALFGRHLPFEKTVRELLLRFFLISCSVLSAVTVVMGLLLSQEDGYGGEVLFWHKWLSVGMSTLVTLSLYVYYQRFNNVTLKCLLVAAILLLLIGGHYGATLTHGDDFITGPVSTKDSKSIDLNSAKVYSDLVEPILREKCMSCHNPDKAKGQLIMSDEGSLKKGGKSGALLTVGESGQSLLMERLLVELDHKHRMPPKGKPQLSENELALIKEWINGGASFTVKLGEIPASGKIHQVAAAMYASNALPVYDFAAADEAVLKSLNTNCCLVTPLSYGSPALSVRLFNRDRLVAKSLDELKKVEKQVVELNMSGMQVTDQDMKSVTRFVNLSILNLGNTAITDQGLAAVANLKKLESVVISGTGVTIAGIRGLMNLPALKRIYAWNTSVETDQVSKLEKANPRIKIETGRVDEGDSVFELTLPLIMPATAFFRKPFLLDFKHPIKGTEILYTLDERRPDSAHAQRFEKPLRISENTMVKAMAVKRGWDNSKVVERNFQVSSIKPDQFALLTYPDPSHKGNGAETLFDLAEGSTDILYASDGKWLGYRNQDFIAEMEFQQPQLIRDVTFSTLTNVAMQSFPPEEVQIWIYDQDNAAKLAFKMKPEFATKGMPPQHNMIKCVLNTTTPIKRMKIVARPLQNIPAWHANKGTKAWFFVDEILIN
jgi:uncharacterized membrane protein